MEQFVYKDKRKLRCGYTTGTCAALAARAAVCALTGVSDPEKVSVRTPSGSVVSANVENLSCGVSADGFPYAACGVIKDGGDDYDVTDGLLIMARAEFTDLHSGVPVLIEGGEGVGRVTRKGLDQPIGEAAINAVPRKMITAAVMEILEESGESRPVRITIFVPEGEAAAKKTFNPTLGIVGGISILGTSGIVEPMSEEALTETIRAQLKVLRAEGNRYVAVAPGNMGVDFFKSYTGMTKVTNESFVKCGNFIGRTIDMAGELGYSGLLLVGHIGKMVKLGNGLMNTHSREGDARMDTLLSCALTAGGDRALLLKLQGANTTEEALSILQGDETAAALHIKEKTLETLCTRIQTHLQRRAFDTLLVGAILYSSESGFLGMTEGAEEILQSYRMERLNREKE